MTIGSAGELTWRYRMWQHLRAATATAVRDRRAARDALRQDGERRGLARLRRRGPRIPARPSRGLGRGLAAHGARHRGGGRARTAPTSCSISLGLIDLGFYTNAEQTAQNVRRFVAERPRRELAGADGPAAGHTERARRVGRAVRRGGRALQHAPRQGGRRPRLGPLSPAPRVACRRRTTSTWTPTTARTRTRAVSTSSRTRSRVRCARRGVRRTPGPGALPRAHSKALAGDS